MASSSHSSGNDATKMEQIITEFFMKSLHTILESRSYSLSSHNYSGEVLSSSPSSSTASSPTVRPRDKWFNLALRDCSSTLESTDFFCSTTLEPLVIDIVLHHRSPEWSPPPTHSPTSNTSSYTDRDERNSKVMERWTIQYKKGSSSLSSTRKAGVLQTSYKKSMILLRSLYLTLRLLPTYRFFRNLNSSGKIHGFTISPRVLSFVEPLDESEMKSFEFTPIDMPYGRLCLSVKYRSSCSDMKPKMTMVKLSPQIIVDYVGSPIADPMKRLPSLSHPSSSFGRPHSWSHGGIQGFPSKPSYPMSPMNAHCEWMQRPQKYPYRNVSPNFSPPPIYGEHPSRALLRCESAPVGTPFPPPPLKLVHLPSVSGKHFVSPSPSFKSSRLGGQTGVDVGGDKMPAGKEDSISRSSSRRDDLDDSEFICPFVPDDDDDIIEASSGRAEVTNRVRGRKTEHGAVGALVRMLKKAPPLYGDPTAASSFSAGGGCERAVRDSVVSCGSKTASDAMEELRGYREMKELLVATSRTPTSSSPAAANN